MFRILSQLTGSIQRKLVLSLDDMVDMAVIHTGLQQGRVCCRCRWLLHEEQILGHHPCRCGCTNLHGCCYPPLGIPCTQLSNRRSNMFLQEHYGGCFVHLANRAWHILLVYVIRKEVAWRRQISLGAIDICPVAIIVAVFILGPLRITWKA